MKKEKTVADRRRTRPYEMTASELIYVRSRILSTNIKDKLSISDNVAQQLMIQAIVFSLVLAVRQFASHRYDKEQTADQIHLLITRIVRNFASSDEEKEITLKVTRLLYEQLKTIGALPMDREDGKHGGTLLWEYSRKFTDLANGEQDSTDLKAIMLIYSELVDLAKESEVQKYVNYIVRHNQPPFSKTDNKSGSPKRLKRIVLNLVLWIALALFAFALLALIITLVEMIQFKTVASSMWQLPLTWIVGCAGILFAAGKLQSQFLLSVSKRVIWGVAITGTALGLIAWVYQANDLRVGEEACSQRYWDGACVPNSYSDIDCDDVAGTARVLYEDKDIYNLDRDGDGIACEPFLE